MDYLDVVVHIFTPETREFYRLEQLWGEVPEVKRPRVAGSNAAGRRRDRRFVSGSLSDNRGHELVAHMEPGYFWPAPRL